MIKFRNKIWQVNRSIADEVSVAARASVPLVSTPLRWGGDTVAQPSSAASLRTMSVREGGAGGGTPPKLTGEDACAMKQVASARKGRRAFTLIELMIVIAIIAILAALIFPVTGALNRRKMITRAKAELGLVKMAIDNYHSKLGFYPPDNPKSYALNPLYFELMGTTNSNGKEFVTLDGSARISTSPLIFQRAFGVGGPQGFANCSATGAGEEGRTAERFLMSELKPAQVATYASFPDVKLLTCSIPGPYVIPAPQGSLVPAKANPFRYNSSNPTNNPNSYDLWVDIVISGKTNRISNWSSRPIIVATP